jgi:hypothetical protein
MNYCINYYKGFRHFDEIDEVILNHYSGSDELVSFVPTLVKGTKIKRVIVNLLDIDLEKIPTVITYIAVLIHDGYNVTAKIRDDENIINLFKDNKIPFFFDKFATNFEMAYGMAKSGVSDIYAVEELGFRMEMLSYLKEKFGVKIRVFPNMAQSARKSAIPSIQRFWIRPEDTELYEDYVDVFEFISDDPSRLSVVYEIYKQRQWLGNLNDLILDFQEPIVPNTGIDPEFGLARLNCGKKCLVERCFVCPRIISLAEAFNDAGLEIIKARYTPESELTEEEKEAKLEEWKKKYNELRTHKKPHNNRNRSVVQNSTEVSK